MQNFLDTFLHFIFPPREEERIVQKLNPESVKVLYRKQSLHGIIVLSHFSHTRIRALIHETKFHDNKQATALLATLLNTYLQTLDAAQGITIVPIPLSAARERARGYNQVTRVLYASIAHTHPTMIIDTHILARTKDTRPQTSLKRSERLTNVARAFSVVHPERITEKHIVLIDDVTTTGATLRAAKAALLLHGASSVLCIALAH